MQDDNFNAAANPPARASRQRSGGGVWLALFAFAAGAGLAGYLGWQGTLNPLLPPPATTRPQASAPVTQPSAPAPQPATAASVQLGTVEARLALLEDRLSRVDFEADAASGNAARAEGLLIAFAARRMVERGEPLGYVADQLRLRFANAQPRAVDTVIAFARQPVTRDELSARLEALSPELTESAPDQSIWHRAKAELSSLFIVHRENGALRTPASRIDRARLMLAAGRIGQAVDEVRRLPNPEAAAKWITDAERYRAVTQALDLIETAAMLEPRRLVDGSGQAVGQPSPLAGPAAPLDAAAGSEPPLSPAD